MPIESNWNLWNFPKTMMKKKEPRNLKKKDKAKIHLLHLPYPKNCKGSSSNIINTVLKNYGPGEPIEKGRCCKINHNSHFLRFDIDKEKQVVRKKINTWFQSLRLIAGVGKVFQNPKSNFWVSSRYRESFATPTLWKKFWQGLYKESKYHNLFFVKHIKCWTWGAVA